MGNVSPNFNVDGTPSLHALTGRSNVDDSDYGSVEEKVEIVRLFLEAGADPNVKDKSGRALLHFFVSWNYFEHLTSAERYTMTQLLLTHGANPNIEDSCGITPLHIIVGGVYDYSILRLILEHGGDPNAKTTKIGGLTPLHYVAIDDVYDADLVQIYLEHGADPNIQNDYGSGALHMACQQGIFEMVQQLDMADPNLEDCIGETPLHYACHYSGKFEIVEWLVNVARANPRPRSGEEPPLESAFRGASHGRRTIMPKRWISIGLDPWQTDQFGRNVLLRIMHNVEDEDYFDGDGEPTQEFQRHLDFLDELLDCAPSLINSRDYQGNAPVHFAAHHCTEVYLRWLVKRGAGLMAVENKGITPLTDAILETDEDSANWRYLVNLAKEGCLDIDATDKNGWTALHWSTLFMQHHNSFAEKTRFLIDSGASTKKVSHAGRSLMHLVGYPFSQTGQIHSDPFDVCREISHILKVDKIPTCMAKHSQGSLDELELLISLGADATCCDKDGNLPFFLAAATSRVSETFLMVRAAAAQGLFDDIRTKYDVKERKSSDHAPVVDKKRSKTGSS